MHYLLSDKRGFNHEILEIQPDTLTKFEMQIELDNYIKMNKISNITEFNIGKFQQYITNKFKIDTKSVRPTPLNLRV